MGTRLLGTSSATIIVAMLAVSSFVEFVGKAQHV